MFDDDARVGGLAQTSGQSPDTLQPTHSPITITPSERTNRCEDSKAQIHCTLTLHQLLLTVSLFSCFPVSLLHYVLVVVAAGGGGCWGG
jgi:hypothetical protein